MRKQDQQLLKLLIAVAFILSIIWIYVGIMLIL